MTAVAHPTPLVVSAIDPMLPPDGPVLIATDALPASDAAFPLAAACADRGHTDIVIVSVSPPAAIPVYGVDGMVIAMEATDDGVEVRRTAAQAQARRLLPHRNAPRMEIPVGEPAMEITRIARALHARLLVVGRGRHTGLDRLLGGEAVLRLLQLGDTPVLAVEPTLTSPPRRVAIAVDFSPFSLYAAQVAMSVAAPDAEVWLVHVAPDFDEMVPLLQERAVAYRADAERALAELRETLQTEHRRVETSIVTGRATEAILTFATAQRADLVVSATHGYGFLKRMLLGSVAATLVRRAPCSVLVVPGSAQSVARAHAMETPNARTTHVPDDSRDAMLAAFSTRNAGRRCTVEIDTPELGAQLLGQGLLFSGASFDGHDDSVSLMFGPPLWRGPHLAHGIRGVTGIDVACTAGGTDQTLRIAHRDGQTLLTLH